MSMKSLFQLISLIVIQTTMDQQGQWKLVDLLNVSKCQKKDRNLRCIHYLGYGDSKPFLVILKLDIYPQKQVKKLQCVGKIKKQLGSRLRILKSTKKGPLSNGKISGGKGHLTDKMIINYRTIVALQLVSVQAKLK